MNSNRREKYTSGLSLGYEYTIRNEDGKLENVRTECIDPGLDGNVAYRNSADEHHVVSTRYFLHHLLMPVSVKINETESFTDNAVRQTCGRDDAFILFCAPYAIEVEDVGDNPHAKCSPKMAKDVPKRIKGPFMGFGKIHQYRYDDPKIPKNPLIRMSQTLFSENDGQLACEQKRVRIMRASHLGETCRVFTVRSPIPYNWYDIGNVVMQMMDKYPIEGV